MEYYRNSGTKRIENGDVSLLNMPGVSANRISSNNCYFIVSTSSDPDGAWKFISYALSKNDDAVAHFANSIFKKSFDKGYKRFTYKDGKPEVTNTTINAVSCSYESTVTEEQVQRYLDFAANCNKLSMHYREIDDIIRGKYQRFINDEITAQKCALNLQSRIDILLAKRF